MKSLLLISCLLLTAAQSKPQKTQEDLGLPELHKIKRVTLSPSYGCRSDEDFNRGYENTALFLSSYSRRHNSPELLFNGACKSRDYFFSATAGDFLDVIADYGDVPIANLTASDVFGPQRTVDSLAQFSEMTQPELGHAYGVLINKDVLQGFFFFRVMAYIPNQKVDLEYVVMDYKVIRREAESPGFDWSTKSVY